MAGTSSQSPVLAKAVCQDTGPLGKEQNATNLTHRTVSSHSCGGQKSALEVLAGVAPLEAEGEAPPCSSSPPPAPQWMIVLAILGVLDL